MKETEKEALELVNYALSHGIISLDDVRENIMKKQKAGILASHPHEIWQGKDGRWRTYYTDETGKRRLIAKKDREKLEETLILLYGGAPNAMPPRGITLKELYPKWLKHKSLYTTAPNYISRIERDWKTYYEGTEITKIPIASFTKLYLEEWAHCLIKKYSMTKKAYYNCTVIIRQALDYAVDLELIETNLFSKIKVDGRRMFRKVQKKPDYTQVFLKNEVDCIFALAQEDFQTNTKLKHRLAPLAILFQFQTGLRLGELCAVRYEDIENPDFIHIQRMFRYETKEVVEHAKTADGDRYVLLTDEAKELIQIAKDYQTEHSLPDNGYIFSINEDPLSHVSVGKLYRKYCEKAGIVNKSSHKVRKTYISCLIDGQININTIRKMVGHADERTTLNCYCFDRNTEEEKIRQIKDALTF